MYDDIHDVPDDHLIDPDGPTEIPPEAFGPLVDEPVVLPQDKRKHDPTRKPKWYDAPSRSLLDYEF